MSSQLRETSKPMISGYDAAFILSSYRCAVPGGRMQLCETTERGGAGLLEAWLSHSFCTAMRRPVVGLRQGRRRERNIMVEIQKVSS